MPLKKVVLLGDSIRMGYEPFVREQLKSVAEIWAPAENCRHSIEHLLNFNTWYLNENPDLIHFNFGLWDCRRVAWEKEENMLPTEIFARNLDVVLTALKERSRARLIWATITPVIQERHRSKFNEPQQPYRVAADVERYNAAAAPVLSRHGVLINDLGKLVQGNRPDELICEDGVHYTENGSRLLGDHVARMIAAELGR